MQCLKLHIAYSYNRDVPEEYRAIPIIRQGMNIMRYVPSLVPAEDRKKLYGYILLADGWTDPILDKENKEHYRISWVGRELAYLQGFLDNAIYS